MFVLCKLVKRREETEKAKHKKEKETEKRKNKEVMLNTEAHE